MRRYTPISEALLRLWKTPCQVAVPDRKLTIRLCGDPSEFLYTGTLSKEPIIVERHTLVMCLEHARDIMTERINYVKDGDVELKALCMPEIRIRCAACAITARVDLLGPTVAVGIPEYCPQCGVRGSLGEANPLEDYWTILSKDFDNMNIELLGLLYEDWDRTKFSTFKEHIKYFLETEVYTYESA